MTHDPYTPRRVIPTQRPLWWKLWRLIRIGLLRLEIRMDQHWLYVAERDGILKTGSEDLHAARSRLAITEVKLMMWRAS